MSAFIVEDDTINRIVTAIYQSDDWDTDHLKQELSKAGISTRPQDLGEAMHLLNVTAVNYRYAHHPPATPDYHYRPVHSSTIQVSKSLMCWLYQCTEGDYDKAPLYTLMEKYQANLAMSVLSHSPEWETATWG